jgi:hypothetical protein
LFAYWHVWNCVSYTALDNILIILTDEQMNESEWFHLGLLTRETEKNYERT